MRVKGFNADCRFKGWGWRVEAWVRERRARRVVKRIVGVEYIVVIVERCNSDGL